MALPARGLGRKRCLVGAALETTAGTGVAGSVTAGLSSTLVYNAEIVPEGLLEGGERSPDGPYGGQILAVPTKRVGRIKFDHEVRHGDAFTTLIEACGFSTTPHKPLSNIASHKALTMKVWEDGVMSMLFGAMGNLKLTIEAGMRVMAAWEFMGVWQAPTAVALPAYTPVTAVTKYQTTTATTLTIGAAVIPLTSKIEIDLGNSLSMRPSIAAVGGNLHAVIDPRERDIKITIDPEMHLIADWDPWSALLAGTAAALNIVVSDGTNTLTIAAPKIQYREIGKGERGPTRTTPITMQACSDTAGDDELSFTFA